MWVQARRWLMISDGDHDVRCPRSALTSVSKQKLTEQGSDLLLHLAFPWVM